ncbi:LOW QUALITY PROTEIN: P2X purinoceptor 4-like [Paramacrobiotus metropolitanus]|uniref:LOW QUALITY PROTEIN: P2X purinoceptor 4-like n=1 Tax=Paramacrobiotus metropolitanus TaxID=2943436 RepID=UPI002445AE29|nr:LOW QUALITY PROTEIN: P2X purinoceptor 4-like [Paramacrobiotus metropolitanus]
MPHQKRISKYLRLCLTQFCFIYQTPRVVSLKSKRIGIIYRTLQLALLAYLVGYVFLYKKSYQATDTADFSVVTKVKGMLYRNVNGSKEVWDNNDFVVPAQESNAFFIATNMVYTRNQSQGICPEDANVGVEGIECSEDFDCEKGKPTPYGNGIKTGKCVQRTGTCEISGWCPTEIDDPPSKPVLSGFETITILVKNHIAFQKFKIKRRNILSHFTQKYLQTCRYDPDDDPKCPIFSVKEIVKYAQEKFEDMAVKGGIIGFHIRWMCDLDRGEEECLPEYSFKRLDDQTDKVAKGWNFRHAYYFYDAKGGNRRDLVKFWGIRFIFIVTGQAGKFSIVPFVMHLGSSLGLFGIVSLVCELVISWCFRSDFLREQKYIDLETIKQARRRSTAAGLLPPDTFQMQVRSNSATPYSSTRHLINVNSTRSTPALARVTAVHPSPRTVRIESNASSGSTDSLAYMDISPTAGRPGRSKSDPIVPRSVMSKASSKPDGQNRSVVTDEIDELEWI